MAACGPCVLLHFSGLDGGADLSVDGKLSNDSITVNKDEPYELVCNAPNTDIKGCLFTNPEGKTYVLWAGAS